MSLVRAELRRLTMRRVFRWMLVLVVLLMVAVTVTIALTHYKPGPEAVARAEAAAAQEFQRQQQFMERDIADCERQPDSVESGWPEDCQEIREWYPPQADMVEWHMPPSFDFSNQFREMITLLAGLLGLYAFVVGASFVGAEWRSGGMMNLLLWQPRRLRVLGVKLAALLGVLLGLWLVLGALWTGGFWLVAVFRGVTDTMTGGTWQSFGLAGLRALGLVLVAGTIGFALASLGRHTAMALGTAIAAFVVGFGGVGLVAAMLQVRFFEAWLWPTYITAWLRSSVTVRDFSAPCEPVGEFGECIAPTMEITWQTAGLAMAAVVAVLLTAAMWQMRRRDVT